MMRIDMTNDLEKKLRFLNTLSKFGLSATHPGREGNLPLVSLAHFFDGNGDKNSIAVNLLDHHPGISFFRDALFAISEKPDVAGVWIEIYDIEWALKDDASWPFAEKVVFVTTADKAIVASWCSILKSDGPIAGLPDPAPMNPPIVPIGYSIWHCVWD